MRLESNLIMNCRLLLLLVIACPGVTPAAPSVTRETRRELTTDRPDSTESPFTVDAGLIQLEMDAASYTRDRQAGIRTTEWVVAPFNLRYGVTPNLEAGIFV